ncbi:MAG: peptidoglycan binding domain-containing protein, partial [Lachnospiraceae bacterium]|nr:peptidoglycan binding domain-containing protein [Lachnospiraceae bacterium]
GGVVYCANFFVGNSKVNGFDVSYKSVKETDKIIQEDADKYTLTADYRNGSETMSPSDIGGNVKLKKSIKEVKKGQNPFIWFMYFFEDSDFEVGYRLEYQEDKLASYINSLPYLDRNNMVEPEDAYVRLEDGEAKLINETDGTVLDNELVKQAYIDAINNFDTELVIENEGCYKVADITSESASIQDTMKKAEDYLDIKAQYDFNGYIYQIPKEELTKMAYIDANGNVEISETNVKLYAKKFAEQFTTYHKDREFYTHDKKHILISGGYYGWQIDEEVEEEELYNEMIQKRDFVKTPACITDAYTLCDMNDIGDNYVEIDLTDQHVYIIRDGKVVYDTLCVSGNESRGMGTPGGVYPITYTQQHAILRGPGYETPVAYWMPFNGGIGMHDATWKSKFGEDYYKYDGSHGCINLSLEAAGEIFQLVEKGMPVVCYWEDEVTYLD